MPQFTDPFEWKTLAIKEIPVNLAPMVGDTKQSSSFENNPLAQAILDEGLRIQDRFSAKPVYAKTGKGYLKSVGVSEIQRAKTAPQKKKR